MHGIVSVKAIQERRFCAGMREEPKLSAEGR